MNKAFYKREILLSIKRYKLTAFKMFILCFICSMMLTFTVSLGASLKHDMDEIVDNKMSLCRNTVILDEEQTDMINGIKEEYLLTSELVKADFYGKSIDDISIEYAGNIYNGVNDYNYDFAITDIISRELCSVNFNIAAISAESTLFSKCDSEEFRANAEFTGTVPKLEKEIMISDYYLEKFGIGKDDIIGKSISVYYRNECVMKDYKVRGVTDSDIFYLHGKKNYSQIYISDKDALNEFSAADKKLCIYSRSFPEAVKKRNELISENHTLEANNAVVLYSAIYTEQGLIIKTFGCLCAALLITTVIVLKGMIKNNIAARRGYFIMLTNMGVSRKNLKRLIFSELTVKMIPSALTGGLSAYPLLIFAKSMTYYALSQQITIVPLSVILCSVSAVFLFGIIILFETVTVSELLRKH